MEYALDTRLREHLDKVTPSRNYLTFKKVMERLDDDHKVVLH